MTLHRSFSSIFSKILVSMILVSLIPLGGLWYISSYKAERDLTASIETTLSAVADSLANRIDAWVEMNIRLLDQNARLGDIISADPGSQDPVLKSITETYDWIYLAFTVGADGTNVGRSDSKPRKFYGNRKYFKQVMRENRPLGQQVVIGKTSGKPALVLAKPITNGAGHREGVIATAMTVKDISAIVTRIRVGTTGFAILLDNAGKVIASGNPTASYATLEDQSTHPLFKVNTAQQPTVFRDGAKTWIGVAADAGHGWRLIVQQDYDEAFATLHEANRNALILLGVTLLIVVLAAYLVARRLSKPIRGLTASADSISRGELDQVVQGTQRNDEIGDLARAVERLSVSVKMAMSRL